MRTGVRILLLICDPDHLCFRRTTYDNIDGPGGTIYVVILGPARPLMYPDKISHYIWLCMVATFRFSCSVSLLRIKN